jgi:hypothetical protein
MQRSAVALEELQNCCRTADAERSFQDFAHEIDAKYEQLVVAKRQSPFNTHSAESRTRLLAAGLRPKVLGFDHNLAAATMKMLSTETKPRPSMTRSKTMGDVAESKKSVADGKEAKSGWRRPSYLKAEQEVLASEIALSAERRARAVAATQRHARRSGIGVGAGPNTVSAITAHANMLPPPTTKNAASRYGLPRKSSAGSTTGMGIGTNAEMLKRVFSESVRSVRRMGRSFTGLSGSEDG